MEEVRSHRDLIVWQKAMFLAQLVYKLAGQMPKHEQYGLTSQMLRAAVSIPTNIAEGNARPTRKDYARFVGIAKGSASELDTLLRLSVQCAVLEESAISQPSELCDEVSRMLGALWRKLDTNTKSQIQNSHSLVPGR